MEMKLEHEIFYGESEDEVAEQVNRFSLYDWVDWDEVDLTHYCYVCGEVSERSVCKRCEVKEMDNIYKNNL